MPQGSTPRIIAKIAAIPAISYWQDVTARCRANIRESDVLACVGGEEFAILLPETTQSAAAQFAERLRAQIGRNALIIAPDAGSYRVLGFLLTTAPLHWFGK